VRKPRALLFQSSFESTIGATIHTLHFALNHCVCSVLSRPRAYSLLQFASPRCSHVHMWRDGTSLSLQLACAVASFFFYLYTAASCHSFLSSQYAWFKYFLTFLVAATWSPPTRHFPFETRLAWRCMQERMMWQTRAELLVSSSLWMGVSGHTSTSFIFFIVVDFFYFFI
jgi:hypothetical protein